MDTSSEDLNDNELADLMADPEMEDDSDGTGEDEVEGVVECGIPPDIANDPVVDTSEQPFSADDFPASEFEVEDSTVQGDEEVEFANETEQAQPVTQEHPVPNGSAPNGHEEGDVAQFRKSLAGLSRQLELDRLTLLHKALSDNGEVLPTLGQIADDISGEKPLTPDGDCDEYGRRSSSRLEGWLSGLSFGAKRRAKKFPR